MPKIKYKEFNFRSKSLAIIDKANQIIKEYKLQGYNLTLRQLYYQFVSHGIIPNSDKDYKNLGSVINDGRLAGLIDWNSITDLTRPNRGISHWDSPQQIIEAIGEQFAIDTRADQDCYIEVFVEKDALLNVIEQACDSLDIPYMSCRGYVSQSSMWKAARRFIEQELQEKETYLIHLGDHDPSGIDMSRDMQERLLMFESNCKLKRIALTMEQIEQYKPPPNPAKITDSRCEGYISVYGNDSWELDALEPQVITELIEDAVNYLTDEDKRNALIKIQNNHRENIKKVAENWDKIIKRFNK